MKNIAGACCAALLLAAQSVACAAASVQDEGIRAELRYFRPKLDTLTVNTGAIHYLEDGSRVDFVNEMGIAADNGPEFRLALGDRWNFDYMKVRSSGKALPIRKLHFNGQIIEGGATTYSNVEMTYAKLAYRLPWLDDGSSRAWFAADLKYVKFDSSVYAPFVVSLEGPRSVYASKSYSAVLPTLGAGVELNLDETGNWRGYAEGSVLPFTKYGPSYDLDINLRYAVGASLDFVAGYRKIKIHADDPEVDFKLKGPYFGLCGAF